MTRIKISIDGKTFFGRLHDTPTGLGIKEALPFQSSASTWGDEIYFEVPVHTPLESGAQSKVGVGELAYWPTMPAFCIFFGPTPMSDDEVPVAASAVNVFGVLDDVDQGQLRSVSDGEQVIVELAGET